MVIIMANVRSRLEELNIDLEAIEALKDENIKTAIILLFNIIEEQAADFKEIQIENQRLRDENNRLKGEQPKPKIKGNKKSQEISSEKERNNSSKNKKKKKRKKSSKKNKIIINRTQKCEVDKSLLPGDAEFKGYQDVIVQDIVIQQDNILFQKEVFYSKSQNKSFMGKLPVGYRGDYGPSLKSLSIILKFVCNVSEPKILDFFRNYGVKISAGTISNILIKDKKVFHTEKDELYQAGLASTIYQQIDDSGARVNGENYYTHVLCNDLYTAYFTTKKKDRLTVLDILRNFRERGYCFNVEAITLLERMRVPKKIIEKVNDFEKEKILSDNEIGKLLDETFPDVNKTYKIYRTRILESAAIAYYHKELEYPIVKLFVADDAPQFKLLTEGLGLCWVHDGRHYKKLTPVISVNVKKLEGFLKKYWIFYKKLLKYKKKPTIKKAEKLSNQFDKLFNTQTGYENLDDRIAKTKAKKNELLLVLKYPNIPLHNNAAELAERAHVRQRDVSLHTITKDGTDAKDTFMTIVQTAKKLGISSYQYIFDRTSENFNLPSLAEIIRKKSTGGTLDLYDST